MWGCLVKNNMRKTVFINIKEQKLRFGYFTSWIKIGHELGLFSFVLIKQLTGFFQIAIGANGRILVVGGQRGCICNLCDGRSGAAPCWSQLITGGSTTDRPQDTTEPISRICSASVKMYLRKGSEHWEKDRAEGLHSRASNTLKGTGAHG